MKITTINPATEEVLAEYESLTEQEVHENVKDSRYVFETVWKKFDISERAKLLRSLGGMLKIRKKRVC